MAPSWASTPNSGRHQPGPPSQTRGPPPICFKCGCEGHFVVDCPQGAQGNSSTPNSLTASHPSQSSQSNGTGGRDGSASQRAPWPINQNGSPAAHFSKSTSAPVVTRYPVPAPAEPQYQQYPGQVPPAQAYPPQHQGPYQPPPNQQYGPSGAPYGYNPPPQQAYCTPPPNTQFSNQGYQPQPYGQYPQQNGPPNSGFPGVYQGTPQPYAPPHTAHPYQQSPSYPPEGGSYAPPQWDNTPPIAYNSSHFQQPNKQYRPQYNSYFRRNTSGSRKQFQSQQSPLEYGSEGRQTSPRTPASASNFAHYPPTPAEQDSVTNMPHAPSAGEKIDNINKLSTSNSAASQAGQEPVSGNSHKLQTGLVATPSGNASKHLTTQENEENKQMEEGEVPEEDPVDEEFNWELEKIFKESPPTENVILAQPLSTKFDMTPVPLIHAGPPPSVSRYARKDNIKEFIRPIRSQPQWSYLQEDPAFADAKTEGELIPLEDVANWMAARQGIDPRILSTRKRERPRESRQDDTVKAANQEPSPEIVNGHSPNEQPKLEEVDHDMPDLITAQAPGTPAAGPDSPAAPVTPTLDRAGTPSLDTEDDVWAPQPGEGALSTSASQDPTEALLASLGVTGSPKPVRKRSAPHLSISTNEDSSCKRLKTTPLQGVSGHEPQQVIPSHIQEGHLLQNNLSTSYSGPVQGKPAHNKSLQNNPPYDNHQYGTPRQSLYSNGASPTNTSPYNSGSYSVSPHSQFPTGPQYRNPPYGIQPPGPYGNPQRGVSQQIHGHPQFHDPWASSHQTEPYGRQPHGIAQNGSAAYTASSQAPYGNGMSPVGNGSESSPTHSTSPHGKSSYQPFNSNQGNLSSRHSSGNTNTRGSQTKVPSSMILQRPEPCQARVGGDDTPSPPVKTPVLSEYQIGKTSDTNDPVESPLTPTSAEILGKLTQSTRKDSNDKKADDTTRRLRRPQPVVADAYSRRW